MAGAVTWASMPTMFSEAQMNTALYPQIRYPLSPALSLRDACRKQGYDNTGARCPGCPLKDLCESEERWLVQKDRLDFGPFSLTQIKAQIQKGEIAGEHMIVDSDSGARKKVKDFPVSPLEEIEKSATRVSA